MLEAFEMLFNVRIFVDEGAPACVDDELVARPRLLALDLSTACAGTEQVFF